MFRCRHTPKAMCSAPALDGSCAQRIAQQSSRKHEGDHENDGESCTHRATLANTTTRLANAWMPRVGTRLTTSRCEMESSGNRRASERHLVTREKMTAQNGTGGCDGR